ncbi:MAG: thioredoxin domain-containing protein [Verrucomicrobiota bacterium]|nr:thioredoxin domain-containing protein [Verrucomicrobiota bacterium]
MTQHTPVNRLAREKSPYLLQHQHNPVDWFAWGEEAFHKARAENKPILLSIGYSTCHWCHVMERESFENPTIGNYLSNHFVSIKVDREERPDVDKIYMTAAQAMNMGGGWPLNVFLTPDLKPFYAGTYFPPEPRYGRPSFLQVLQRIQEIWSTRQQEVRESAADLHRQLISFTAAEQQNGILLAPEVLHHAAKKFKAEYDAVHGGFGGAPKFPRPSQPALLLRYGVRVNDREAIEMVLHTCRSMAAGGMYDQLGGGFARYSFDAKWLVTHFEKILYDNAQLVHLYLDAWLVSKDPSFTEVARDILHYVTRDMTHPDGGFFSAEDADSEGKEGKFYSWTRQELSHLLTPEEFNVTIRYFGITEEGNFVDHSDPEPLLNQNVLSVVEPDLPPGDRPLLASSKHKMLAARAKRVRPHRDDKVLSSWNGMMLGAFARAGIVLNDPGFLAIAERNLAFIKKELWDASSRTLYHRWREGERDHVQLLDAYANMLAGTLELYQANLDPACLEFAVNLAESMMTRFYDSNEGGFYQSGSESSDLILRLKEDYDGAEPSGNSVAVLALLKLAAISERPEFRLAAEKTLRLFAERLQTLPQAVPYLLTGLDYFLEEPRRVVIAGIDASNTLLHAAHSVYQPNKVVLSTTGPVEPFAKTLKPVNNAPTAYVCTGSACQPPTTDPNQLSALLK